MTDPRRERFERLALPHLDAAYNLARWLCNDPARADDLVQEAYLRAWRYFDAFRGDDMRVWLLTILRNRFATSARQASAGRIIYTGDEPEPEADTLWSQHTPNPEALLLADADAARVNRLVAALPPDQKEVLLLREVEELSYADIARITEVPVGTVMSRLARARTALRRSWNTEDEGER